MTKAESVVVNNPLWHLAHTTKATDRFSNQQYQVRVYLHRNGDDGTLEALDTP